MTHKAPPSWLNPTEPVDPVPKVAQDTEPVAQDKHATLKTNRAALVKCHTIASEMRQNGHTREQTVAALLGQGHDVDTVVDAVETDWHEAQIADTSKPFWERTYYDPHAKEYILKNQRGTWLRQTESQLKRRFKMVGVRTSPPKGEIISDADPLIQDIQDHRDLHYAGALAGWRDGYYEQTATRFLVTESPTIIEPVKGEWPVFREFMENLLGDPDHDQLPVFLGWLQIAYKALYEFRHRPGQAMVIAGPRDCGKSFMQKILTPILGGRAARPYRYMIGTTDFNSDLFLGEHLMIEDEAAATDIRSRKHFGAQLKQFVANDEHRQHAKNKNAYALLRPFWRVTITLNEDPEDMMVLPPLVDGVEDKVIILRAKQCKMPMPTRTEAERTAFRSVIISELPAFLHWLLYEFKLDKSLQHDRFGVVAWHHPALVKAIDELSPEFRLLQLIDGNLFDVNAVWTGTSAELEAALTDSELSCYREANKLLHYGNSCGTYMSRLAKKVPERVQKGKRGNNGREWVIYKTAHEVTQTEMEVE